MKAPAPDVLRRLRRKRRQGFSLRDRSITMKTRVRYFVAVTAILPALEDTCEPLEDFLVEWIDQEYVQGTAIADTLSGLHHFMPWCRRIRAAWKLCGLWRRIERPKQAPPLRVEVAAALVGRALELENLRLAFCLCLGFWGMLRAGELFPIKWRRLLVCQENMIVRLGETKTGVRRQVDENVVVSHVPSRHDW